MKDSVAQLQQRLGYQFQRDQLLQQALTHRSFSAQHNERLEFLGDSVLSLLVSDLLFQHLPDEAEGLLSRTRANLVREEFLHRVALELGIPALLKLGEGEARSGGRERPSILADAVEALLGAVFLDGGFEAANAVGKRLYQKVDLSAASNVSHKDGKTALQEILQGRKMSLPVYAVVDIRGAEHAQVFVVSCKVAAMGLETTGEGASRRAAEQVAARQMLQQLQEKPNAPKSRQRA